MLPMLVNRANVEPFGKDGAFYSVGLKRGNSPLKKFQENNTLSASDMLKEFRDEVKKCVKGFTGERQNKYFLTVKIWEESVKCTMGTSQGVSLRENVFIYVQTGSCNTFIALFKVYVHPKMRNLTIIFSPHAWRHWWSFIVHNH